MERRPDWILLNTRAVAGCHCNSTTASDRTRNGETIEVSFCLRLPPHPSILFVHSSDMNLTVPPAIVYTVDDLLLLSVNMGSGPYSISPNSCDFFIYRAHSSRPSLQLLKRPHPYFNNVDVGLLPRLDGHYTVAALIPTAALDQYEFHLFHSEMQDWSSSMLSVEVPQVEFPVKIPRGSVRLHRHLTSSVITIGGEGGTMGWVDLWRGMLLCDVLDSKLSLRAVPLPLPLKELSYNDGNGYPYGLGAAGQRRGITFIRDKTCLKLVHLEVSDVRRPGNDSETGVPSFRVDNWALTTWSNTRMTNSYEDWHQDYVLKASDITIDNPAVSQLLQSGLLMHHSPPDEQLALHNLSMSQPAPCMNGEDVIYLVARKKHMHPKAWILAVDMENGKLQAAEEFSAVPRHSFRGIYRPSIISKYMNHTTTPAGCCFPFSSKESHNEQLRVGLKPIGENAEEWNNEASAVGRERVEAACAVLQ
ncbi:hypothetical protein ABZP36_002852 [Zizania latifolia]